MAAEVKILIEGYTNADSGTKTGEERTCPTITLVRDGELIIVVDPGVLKDQQILVDALKNEGLGINDVNTVCTTHSHIDHYRNIGMFPNAQVLDYFGLWNKDTVEDWQEEFSDNIQVLKTPGHDYTGISLIVRTDEGVIAICGDVFWKENYPEYPEDDPYASDHQELKESRRLVLGMADLIVPGHGPMYKTLRNFPLNAGKDAKKATSKESKNDLKLCSKCNQPMTNHDKCNCRPWLCYKCCECGIDCDNCSCSHKI